MLDWRLVFEQSRVNGGLYTEENLPQQVVMPVLKNSWFQKRLKYVREQLKSEVLGSDKDNSKKHPDRANNWLPA